MNRKIKKFISILLVLTLAGGNTACSTLMAMSGEKEPDMNYLEPGTSLEEVESQFGAPVESVKQNGNTVNTYEYEMGDPPDSGRGMAHLAINLYSLFLYEIFFATWLELFKYTAEDYIIHVTFDESGKVISSSKPIRD